MFMSLFSHFEIAQAQKWRFSLSPVKGTNSKPNAEATSSSAESKTAGKDKNPSQPGGPRPVFASLHHQAVPAVTAVVGFYFIDRNYIKEIKQGSSVSNLKMLAEVKERAKTLQKPKLAPQLDGLYCFETLVMN
ncbi:hypothetical protein JHK85_011399 [Glycine max]|nr:hypothetical protein JHK85_011399 [Glycine max]KAG5067354.1 hypothetical protein JHK86_011085 [Glycine max]